MTTIEAITLIESASPAVLFGDNAKASYRRLAMLCHPDKVDGVLKPRAAKAFIRLRTYYSQWALPFVAKLGDWSITEPLTTGDICDLYITKPEAVLKIARATNNNDLMEAEGVALKALHADKRSDEFKRYIPRLLETFKASGRRTNVLTLASSYYSLADIKALYPNGLDFRHCIWMLNRLLSALGFAHANGICHGAILPEHLLYHPETHALLLIDWCYSVKIGQPIIARVKAHAAEYPPEVARKTAAMASTDLYMAARAIYGASAKVPKRFKAFLEHCQAESPHARPDNAWSLQDRWRSLAIEEFGPPQYIRLEIPKQ
jgi:serine/threonine protein kinase